MFALLLFNVCIRLKPSINVEIIPQLQDNYSYVVKDEANLVSFIVDACSDGLMEDMVKEEEGCELLAILTTHKHWDHVGGNESIASRYPGIKIYGPKIEQTEIPSLTDAVEPGDKFDIGKMQV